MEFSRSTRPEGKSLVITIPVEIVRHYGINPFDLVVLDIKKVEKS